MSNFIIIGPRGSNNSIRTAVFSEIVENDHPNVRFLQAKKATGAARWVQRVVTSKKLNHIADMPLRMRWEIGYKQIRPLLSETEENYIIFVPGEQMFQRTSPALIRDLRKNHSNCKLVFYFVDGIERCYKVNGYDEAFMLRFLEQFDLVCTYSHSDAEKYGVRYVDIPVRAMPTSADTENAYTLHFSGADKKRAGMLADIKRRLEPAGISHYFHVVFTPDSGTRNREIEYADSKPYAKIIEDSLKANCLLEILAKHNSSATLRYKEAVIYNKKLLTTNPEITLLPYYDARWMRYFEKAEDIDLEWLRAVEPVDYGYKGDFSVFTFLNTVEKLCEEPDKA